VSLLPFKEDASAYPITAATYSHFPVKNPKRNVKKVLRKPVMTTKHARKCFVILLIALASCTLLSRGPRMQAQQLATLSVTVTDPSNRVVPGAQVTLTSTQTSLIRTQAGDRAGLAVLSALTPGDYRLAVKAEGFSEYQQPLTLTLRLHPHGVGEIASDLRETLRHG
jgi:Carboxypeptidase regulatory-like domain